MNRSGIAPYLMPVVYAVAGIVLVIGLVLIAIRAAWYGLLEVLKSHLRIDEYKGEIPTSQPEYISTEVINEVKCVVDRRVAERQPDGTIIIRDPITFKTWKTDGTQFRDD